jgi:hypothetical protein
VSLGGPVVITVNIRAQIYTYIYTHAYIC